MKIERRAIAAHELRADPGSGKITGYAAVFNSYSERLGWFREIIIPGAFAASIETDDVRALWNHDANYVLGRNRAGTLLLEEDARGLKVEIDPPDTQWARDLQESIRRGDVTQMSFGFFVQDEIWRKEDGDDIRELRKVELFDVSPVTYPAYPATEVGIRSLKEIYDARPQTPAQPDGGSGEPAKAQPCQRRNKLSLYQKMIGG